MSETGKTIALIKALAGKPSDAQVASAVEGYLEEHPVGMGAFADDYSSSSTYAVGDHVIYNGSYYVCNTAITTAEEWTAAHWTITTVGEEIEDLDGRKAEINGYYEDMTVGDAEQLVATVGVTDKVPYNFRTAGGSADIGDREVDTLVGGTVAWNQIVNYDGLRSKSENNVTIVDNNDGSYTVSTTAQGASDNVYLSNGTINVISGHKYLLVGCPSGGSGSTYRAYLVNNVESKSDFGNGAIYNATGTGVCYVIGMYIYKDAVITSAIKFKPQVFDLTQMFGSTIADYIYTLETGTAGAGVAWFKNLFPKAYYAYDAGSLQSVQAKSHILRGFNAWDEEWEVGDIDATTGNDTSNPSLIRSKNYIPIIPATQYYFRRDYITSNTFRGRFYDADKNYIGAMQYDGSACTVGVFKTPRNACFMRFAMPLEYGNVYKHDICINLHWDGERDGEYEPYSEHAYPLDSDLTLRGIPKLDSNNKLYYDGDVYESDGTVTRKYAFVDLGSLTWEKSSSGNKFYASVTPNYKRGFAINLICARYIYDGVGVSNNYYGEDKTIRYCNDSPNQGVYQYEFYIHDEAYSDASAFKTAMNGVYVVYELETPTTESADPYQNPQIVDDFGTEEYVDAGVTASTPTRDVAIPVGHETVYRANLRAKLEMMPNSPDSNGDYVVRHNNGVNTYVALEKELPTLPSEDGTYHLKCVVDGSTKTLSWEEQE